MASAGSIFVDLLLRDAQYNQAWGRARGSTKAATGQITSDVNNMNSAFMASINPVNNLTNALTTIAGSIASAFSVQKIIQYSDTWKQLEGRLTIVSGSMAQVAKVQEDLFEIAQRTRQPLEGITSFYSRLAQFIPEAERAQYDLLGVTESVSAALAITGETSYSSTAAMIQFTQAIGTNFEAAGQELRSLQEQAPRLTQALMNALGDGTKSLQQLKAEGLLTRESVLNALSGMGEEGRRMAEELAKIPLTVGQAFTRVNNSFLKYLGQSESVRDATATLASGLTSMSKNVDSLVIGLGYLSVIFAGKLLGSLYKVTAEFITNIVRQRAAQKAAYDLAVANNAGAVAQYNMARAQVAAGASATVMAKAAQNVTASQMALNAAVAANVTVLGRLGASLLAAFGGPVGAAITALGAGVYYFATATTEAENSQNKFNAALDNLRRLNDILEPQQDKMVQNLELERQERVENALAIIKQTEALVDLNSELTLNNALSAARLGNMADLSLSEKRMTELQTRIEKMKTDLREVTGGFYGPQQSSNKSSGSSNPVTKDAANALKDQEAVFKRYRELITGLSKDELERQDTVKDLTSLLGSRYIPTQERLNEVIAAYDANQSAEKMKELDNIYKSNRQYIDGVTEAEIRRMDKMEELSKLLGSKYIPDMERLSEVMAEYDRQVDESNWAKKMEQMSEQAAKNIQSTFADFLFDPLDDGFEGMVRGFADAIRKMIAEAASAAILEKSGLGKGIFDLVGGIFGGGGGSGLGGLFGGFGGFSGASSSGLASGLGGIDMVPISGFFADGGYLGPGKWGVAGEEGAELIYGGRSGATIVPQSGMGGGNTYNIDARGADVGAVARLENALVTLAGPGQIEKRVMNAQARGKL